ncbi:UNVERIFIED_CONTAM: TIR-only protein [Sesamum radiatum]|uniref:TIR-only protein n=1 Tax=Sesamum radiatum TaxID=300843 RepID=A0AAW2LQ31_SESRA
MQRRPSAAAARINSISRQIIRTGGGRQAPPCDVFINHRGIDTKRNVAGLLYHHLRGLRLRPFLDSKSMKPGTGCSTGLRWRFGSVRKKVVPIFCDVKPSELRVKDDGSRPARDLEKFRWALEEAKYTVGITFDTLRGDWPEFLASTTDAVIKNLIEVEEEGQMRKQKHAHASLSS